MAHKLAFGFGGVPGAIYNITLFGLVGPLYNITLGLDPVAIGFALAIPRIWDAITDPIVGYWSDNCRSRFGRRRPFLVVGAILFGLTTLMFFSPPTSADPAYLANFLMFAMFLSATTSTIYGIPYNALGFELTADYHERTRLMAVSQAFPVVFGIAASWIFPAVQWPGFGSAAQGFTIMGMIIAVVGTTSGLIAGIFLKERFVRPADLPGQVLLPKISFLPAVVAILRNRPFVLVLSMGLLVTIGLTASVYLQSYLIIYVLNGGDQRAGSGLMGWAGTTQQVSGFVSIVIIAWMAVRMGKRAAVIIVCASAVTGYVLLYFITTSGTPYLILLSVVLFAPGTIGPYMLYHACMADICDYDELQHGTRREGLFTAVAGWFYKLGGSINMVGAGYLVKLSGFDISLGTNQTPATLLNLTLLSSVIPAGAFAAGALLMYFYPLSEHRQRQTRLELEARRGVI